jgi:signal transduction histidine kinase
LPIILSGVGEFDPQVRIGLAGSGPRLFERFHQVRGARGRVLEGTGIGLALVQELVNLHGGTKKRDCQHLACRRA